MQKSNFVFEKCGSCGCPAELYQNKKSKTFFYGCTAHERTDCKWSASPTTGEQWNVAGNVARASVKRSKVVSLYAATIAKLVGKGRLQPQEAIVWIAELGLLEAARLAA